MRFSFTHIAHFKKKTSLSYASRPSINTRFLALFSLPSSRTTLARMVSVTIFFSSPCIFVLTLLLPLTFITLLSLI
ncbi:hypothetical protein BOTBODRAFT_179288 [Botryobasidium botryosum FD-172 SS1]|uniref:Uncharacterized protein n=1 Tax=Botryobasidium botryosum (strain FD-172 SS1) TaxID=930990 RepID=A0A067M319_BOTB1|nr:hypothetical protein BOTBODRAFT_179288 [Botryobasidium botryosum FD-172 SS1]